MSIIRRTDQGGSIVSFVVVGVVMAFVLIGGVYVLTQRSEQARKEQAIATADKQAADNAKKSTNANSSKSIGSNTSKVSDNSSNTTSTSTALPTTGPESTTIELAGVYFLTASIVGYSLSRRNLMRYL